MKRALFAGLVIAVTTATSVAPSAFASGYGPAPFYRPYVGAPSSQRGQNSQTLATERMNERNAYADDVGGVAASTSEMGESAPPSSHAWTYRHH
ncbi:hypothetical protein [Burkholderia sp. Ac-20365]|jgi:hypothetical protein|uniref:hypothetical protein n=1 Tax=Burkholderia sp. Ac-20365 TaxID=2703897 RepID=UPI00197BDBF0|nr:hypothetical protein [Burkholderia sp. Ac-20365]MBN3761568.1 hypothetical protein [Burkholderia sp. Ac-20365]